jgi:hypothetical protein
VQFEAIALEPLDLQGSALDLRCGLVGDREAEHTQSAVLFPVL